MNRRLNIIIYVSCVLLIYITIQSVNGNPVEPKEKAKRSTNENESGEELLKRFLLGSNVDNDREEEERTPKELKGDLVSNMNEIKRKESKKSVKKTSYNSDENVNNENSFSEKRQLKEKLLKLLSREIMKNQNNGKGKKNENRFLESIGLGSSHFGGGSNPYASYSYGSHYGD